MSSNLEVIVTDISEAEREKRAYEIFGFLVWARIEKELPEGWDPEIEAEPECVQRLLDAFANHPEWWNEFYTAMVRMKEEFRYAKIACEAVL